MEFKKLEIEPQTNRFRSWVKSPHVRKSFIVIILGASLGFLYYYFTEGRDLKVIPVGDIIKSLFLGGFFGFFITNSPCARGRC